MEKEYNKLKNNNNDVLLMLKFAVMMEGVNDKLIKKYFDLI